MNEGKWCENHCDNSKTALAIGVLNPKKQKHEEMDGLIVSCQDV